MIAPHLKKAVQLMQDPTVKAECTFCGKQIDYPKLYVTIGKRVSRGSTQHKPVEEKPPFFSASKVKN